MDRLPFCFSSRLTAALRVLCFWIPEPPRGSCAVSALWGHLRLHSGSLRSVWEFFSLFYLASRRAPVLQIGPILETFGSCESFFLRFSVLDVPYISKGPWPRLRPRPARVPAYS